jgi:sulfite reductase beta subunit-like hemoprotein
MSVCHRAVLPSQGHGYYEVDYGMMCRFSPRKVIHTARVVAMLKKVALHVEQGVLDLIDERQQVK